MTETPAPRMDPQLDPVVQQAVQVSFARQGMMQAMGVRLLALGPGLAEFALPHSDRVTQQQGGFHGGAVGALADIAGGYAAMTVAPAGMEVTTVEYKINFLAAYHGGELVARGRVVRAGRRLIVTAVDVAHRAADGRESSCAVMQQTIIPVPRRYD